MEYKSPALRNIYKTAKAMFESDLISKEQMQEFEKSCVIDHTSKLKLGDRVNVKFYPDRPWTKDWKDVECEVYGLRYDYNPNLRFNLNSNKTINITLLANDGLTDGFLPEDLILIEKDKT